jgi:hypothetical protein
MRTYEQLAETEPEHDFRLEGEGPMTSVFRLIPLTTVAKVWVALNVGEGGEDFQPDYPTLYVEHRYIEPLLEGIGEAGLTVNVIERAVAASTPGSARLCQHCNEPVAGAGTCPHCGLQAARETYHGRA